MQLSRLPWVVLATLGLSSQVAGCSDRTVGGEGEDEQGQSETETSSCLTQGPCLDVSETDTGPCLGAPLPDFGPCLEAPIPDLPSGTDETEGTDETDTVPCLAGDMRESESDAADTSGSLKQRIVDAGVLPRDVLARLGLLE